jgi:uncharacterized repeat protein (TIGR01451 family)
VYVRDGNTNALISGATVSGAGTSGSTGSAGTVKFSNLQIGSYSFSASKSGYISGSSSASVIKAGDSLSVTIYLTPIGSITVYVRDQVTNALISGATVSGAGLDQPISVSQTVNGASAPALSISKSISPTQVVDNDRVTYTFIIQNTGNLGVVATDNASISDLFSPILSDLAVTFNGTAWSQGTEYSYDGTTGLFTTVPGQLTVPAAVYTQNPVTGEYVSTPGIATLVVTGTI